MNLPLATTHHQNVWIERDENELILKCVLFEVKNCGRQKIVGKRNKSIWSGFDPKAQFAANKFAVVAFSQNESAQFRTFTQIAQLLRRC